MKYKNIKQLFLLLILLMLSTLVNAAPEAWYTYWAAGFVSQSYNSRVQSFIDDAKNLPQSFDRSQVGSDTFGFYWPYNANTIVGFVINNSSDTLTKVDTKEPKTYGELFIGFPYIKGVSEYVSINQALYGASIMHFFGKEAGDGFYLRGDAGIARLKVESDLDAPISNKSGYGLLLGFGYGIPVSEESRVLLSMTYSSKRFGSYNYSTTMVSIGGLW